jgi:hypothetical protein
MCASTVAGRGYFFLWGRAKFSAGRCIVMIGVWLMAIALVDRNSWESIGGWFCNAQLSEFGSLRSRELPLPIYLTSTGIC